MTAETKVTPEYLAELKRLCDEATPGPWVKDGEWVVPEGFDNDAWVTGDEDCPMPVVGMWIHDNELLITGKDARFIAAARTAIPALIQHVERLERENDELAEDYQDLGRVMNEALLNAERRIAELEYRLKGLDK